LQQNNKTRSQGCVRRAAQLVDTFDR